MAISNYRILFEAVLNDTQLKAGVHRLIDSNSDLQKAYGKVQSKINQTADTAVNANKKMNHSNNDMGKGLKGIAGGWINITKKVLAFGAATSVIRGAISVVGDMITNVMDLDTAIVNLQKVSDLSGDSLKRFTEDAFQAGQSVARSGTEMIDAATEFAKAGYGEDKIIELGRIASMYQNVADKEISASEAASTIIAMTKAFADEGLSAIQVIDKINEVSNKYAVSSADIATALPKVASTLALAGNTADESMGLLTAATELMPNQASRVARGMRSITLNLQGMTAEGDKSLVLTAKMEKSFSKIGMTLTDETTGGLKSTYDILKELSGKWKDLTPDQQKYYAALIGGKQQVDVVTATLKNFKSAVGATEAATNSAGSAAKENEKYLKSIEGRVAGFKSEFQKLSQQLIDSKLIKSVVSFGTGFLKVMTANDALLPKLALLTGAIVGVTKAFSFMQLTALPNAIKGFGNFSTQLGNVINGTKQVNQYMGDTMTTVTKSGSRMKALGKLLPINPYMLFAAAIVAVGYALYKHYKAYDDTVAKIADNASKIKKIKGEIKDLEEIKKDKGLTQDEQDYLDQLKIERDILTDNNKLLQEKIEKLFRINNSTKITDPTTGETHTGFQSEKIVQGMKVASNEIDIYKKKNRELREEAKTASGERLKQINKEIEANQSVIDARTNDLNKEKANIQSQLDYYDKTFKGHRDDMTDAEKADERYLKQLKRGLGVVADGGKISKKRLLSLGDAFGVVTNKSGKTKVNLNTFIDQMQTIGASKEEIETAVEKLQGMDDVTLTGAKSEVTDMLTDLGFTKKEIKNILDNMKLVNAQTIKPKTDDGEINKTFATVAAMKRLIQWINNHLPKTSADTKNGIKNISDSLGTRFGYNAKGTKSAQKGLSAINEEGWELIKSKDGSVRIANGGEQGVTKLNQGDEVITHPESQRMISGDKDIELEGFAKGTISTKRPSKGKYSKESSSKLTSSMDTLQYQLDMGYISEQTYYKKLAKLRNTYYKKGKISLDDYRSMSTKIHDYDVKLEEKAQEKKEKAREKAYDKEVARLEKLQNKYTAQQELLNIYADKQIEKIDKKIEGYEKEKEEISKQNEQSERANSLMEAQAKLAEAKNRKVKVYRAGKGFGYEGDKSAVDEAQKELNALKEQYALDEKIASIDDKIAKAEEEKAKWAEVTSNWQEEQEIKNLEQTAGTTLSAISSSIGGSLSTFDKMYSSAGAKVEGYTDALAKTEDTDKIQSATTIANLINANQHATGTLASRGGLSLVGERGAELRVLGKGDGIMPNDITKNLMELGRFNAKELINAGTAISKTGGNITTAFNFNAGSIVVNGDNAETLAKDIINNMNRIVQQTEKQRN